MSSNVSLSYGGFSTFSQVRIGRFEHLTDASAEKPSRGITKHIIEGDAIITAAPGVTIEQRIATVSNLLSKNGLALIVRITEQDGTTNHDIVNIEGDDRTGPIPSARIVEIIGTGTALVQFSFEWNATYATGATLSIVKEFVMQARFTIDTIGNTTLTRTGYIVLNKSSGSVLDPPSFPTRPATASAATAPAYGYSSVATHRDKVADYPKPPAGTPTNAFPEEYRRLVAGNLFPGFRREGQEFGTDETRTRMVFTVTDKEYPRGMPAPVRSADVNFEYERSIGGGEKNAIGTKRFIATLSGGPQASPVDLLVVAIRLSQNRIFFSTQTVGGVTYKPDLITRIAVRELDMLNSNTIQFEVEAQGNSILAAAFGAGTVPQGTPFKSGGLLINLLSDLSIAPAGGAAITFTFSPTSYPDAFGNFGAYRVTPNWYDPELTEDQKVWNTTVVLAAAEKESVVYEFPVAFFDAVINTAADSQRVHLGKDNSKTRKDVASASGPDNPYLSLSSMERHAVASHMCVIPSQDLAAADQAFQIRKPLTVVTQHMEATRMNAAPERSLLPMPANAVIVEEDFPVHGGVADTANNRIMAAVFTRTFVIMDPGGTDANTFFNKVSGSNTYRQAWPGRSTVTADVGTLKLPYLATRDLDAFGNPNTVGDEKFETTLGNPSGYVAT